MSSPKAVIGSMASPCIIVHYTNAIVNYLDDFHYALHQPITAKFPTKPKPPIPHLPTILCTIDQLIGYLNCIYIFYGHGTSLVHFIGKVASRDTIFQLPQAGSTSESGVSRSPGQHREIWWLLWSVSVLWAVFGLTCMSLLIRSSPLAICSTRSQSA